MLRRQCVSEVLALLSDQLNSFGVSPLVSCVGLQTLGAHAAWTMGLFTPGTSMLVSAPKTLEKEEHEAAIRSRCWCNRRQLIFLHSLGQEVLPAERTKTLAETRRQFSHECHSYAGYELRWRPQNAYFIRHFFQAERLGLRALALIVDDGFHFPPDAHVEELCARLPSVSQRGNSSRLRHHRRHHHTRAPLG